jgi:hypothetical protein
MQKSEVVKLMAVVAAEYGDRFATSNEKADLWLNILGHATFEEAVKAITQVLGSPAKFPPTVGEINQKILEARTGTSSLDWATEWERVLKAASNSSYNAPAEAGKLASLTLSAVGGVQGLKEIAALGHGELMAIRAQFRQRFEMLSTKKVEREFEAYIENTANKTLSATEKKLLEVINGSH